MIATFPELVINSQHYFDSLRSLYIFDYQKSNENRGQNSGIINSVDEIKMAHFRAKRIQLTYEYFKAVIREH